MLFIFSNPADLYVYIMYFCRQTCALSSLLLIITHVNKCNYFMPQFQYKKPSGSIIILEAETKVCLPYLSQKMSLKS